MGQMTTIPRNYKEMQKICDSCIAQHGEQWKETHCHKCNVSFVRDSLDKEVIEHILEIIEKNANNPGAKKAVSAKKNPVTTIKVVKARKTAMDSMVTKRNKFEEDDDFAPLLEKDESEDYVFSGLGYNNDDDYYDD